MNKTSGVSRVMVIGAGVMGRSIAAHIAGVGATVLLLDILPPTGLTDDDRAQGITEASPQWRNRLAIKGVQRAKEYSPPLFFDEQDALRIEPGNIDDDLPRLSECDLVIEAVPESLKLKQDIYAKIEIFLKPGIMVTSNTSGILLPELLKDRSDAFRRQFMITHFFNPVRYMHLVEVVLGNETNQDLARSIMAFLRDDLGKGIVEAKNTPGFVANRIGCHALSSALRWAMDLGLRPKEADALTGPLMGRAASATFRTLDLVGLDTMNMVYDLLYNNLPDDPEREVFKTPAICRTMVDNGLLGSKTNAGFYRSSLTEHGEQRYLSIDYGTLAYIPISTRTFPSADAAASIEHVGERLRAIIDSDDEAGRYLWNVLRDHLVYAASMVPAIADRVHSVDEAMRWGYNYSSGPFELWDALGVDWVVSKLREEQQSLPPLVEAVMAQGEGSFYVYKDGQRHSFDPASHSYKPVASETGVVTVEELLAKHGELEHNDDARIIDMGDRVWLFECTRKDSRITPAVLDMLHRALDRAEKENTALVLGNQGKAFCRGMDSEASAKTAQRLQDITRKIRCANVPVVAAPHGDCLGCGCAMVLHADAVVAAAETRMGLMEPKGSTIPFGGGVAQLFANMERSIKTEGPMPKIMTMFDMQHNRRVAANAKQARGMGFLKKSDRIVFNTAALLQEAKQCALDMLDIGYTPPAQRQFRLPGSGGAAVLFEQLDAQQRLGTISDADMALGAELAILLTGGNTAPDKTVSEEAWLLVEHDLLTGKTGGASAG